MGEHGNLHALVRGLKRGGASRHSRPNDEDVGSKGGHGSNVDSGAENDSPFVALYDARCLELVRPGLLGPSLLHADIVRRGENN